ncbi:MAG: hemolysin III family protein, partial [Solirubrobacterales bacterium]
MEPDRKSTGPIDAALDTMADRRDAARESMADAKDAAVEAIAKVKPRLRGVSHEYAFFVSLALGAVLVILADGGSARVSVAIYAASLSALFGVSALYHRV